MNEMSRILRAATENPVKNQVLNDPAFVAATPESVTVYAYVNLSSSTEQPVKVQFSLDTNRIIETHWSGYVISAGYWGFNATPASTRTFAATVVTPGTSGPFMFSYLRSDGSAVSIPPGGITNLTDLRSIAAVKVTLVLGTSSSATTTVTLQNTVGLPNLGIARTS